MLGVSGEQWSDLVGAVLMTIVQCYFLQCSVVLGKKCCGEPGRNTDGGVKVYFYMCESVCVCLRVPVHVCMCLCLRPCVRVHAYVCLCTCASVRVSVCAHVCVCASLHSFECGRVCVRTRACVYFLTLAYASLPLQVLVLFRGCAKCELLKIGESMPHKHDSY